MKTYALTFAIITTVLVGCNRTLRTDGNLSQVPAASYDATFQAAVEVLRDHGFRVNRQDYRYGIVNTHPLESSTALEPWRFTNSTLGQATQSTLSHTRRIATVHLEPVTPEEEQALRDLGANDTPPADDAAVEGEAASLPPRAENYRVRVEVVMQNHQQPQRRLIVSARGKGSEIRGIPSEWRERGITSDYWIDTGRDPYLEQRLLDDILRRTARRADAQ